MLYIPTICKCVYFSHQKQAATSLFIQFVALKALHTDKKLALILFLHLRRLLGFLNALHFDELH